MSRSGHHPEPPPAASAARAGSGADAQPGAAARRAYAWRVGAFFAALFVIYGVQVPYLPVWLNHKGLSPKEIAVVTAAPFFVRLAVTPAVCLAADRLGAHRKVIVALGWLGLISALALSQAGSFWPILALSLVLALSAATIMPLTETIAVSGVTWAGLDYGRMRLWGSITFVIATFVGGAIVERVGGGAGVWLIVFGALATALVAHALPEAIDKQSGAPPAAGGPSLLAAARQLVASRVFLLFLVAVGAIHGAHAMFYTFGALNWQRLGLSSTWVGLLWAVAVAAEVALFALSGAVVRRFGVTRLMIAGGAAAVLRWMAMAGEPPLVALMVLQVLHALSYGATHIAAIHFIRQAVPAAAAGTAQALYATVAAGIALGTATLAAGSLYGAFGSLGYLAMAAMAAGGFVAALAMSRHWDGGALWREPLSPTAPDRAA